MLKKRFREFIIWLSVITIIYETTITLITNKSNGYNDCLNYNINQDNYVFDNNIFETNIYFKNSIESNSETTISDSEDINQDNNNDNDTYTDNNNNIDSLINGNNTSDIDNTNKTNSVFAASNNHPKEHFLIKSDNLTYNYCPSIIKEGNVYNVFYCSNQDSGIIKDSIYYSQVIENTDTYTQTDKIEVLSANNNEWDSMHVCDPSVIEGNFKYNGINYRYLMAYLGCSTTDNQQNKIGLAVSNSLTDSWIKIKEINPIISIEYNVADSGFQWGCGQPSLIQKDGYTYIYYTVGESKRTYEKVEKWDLSDLNVPKKILSEEINSKGIKGHISNADFSYDNTYLYMVCDNNSIQWNTSVISVPESSNIYKGKINESGNVDTWECIGIISNKETGYGKNHNCGFIRGKSGNIEERSIAYTGANVINSSFLDSLFTYRIEKFNINF